MISLCTDYNFVLSALNTQTTQGYIKEYIRLYLESYGCSYNFQEFFLQIDSDSDAITAILMRYNDQIYILTHKNSDVEEISAFLGGFSGCYVIADKILLTQFSYAEICYIMGKAGVDSVDDCPHVRLPSDTKEIGDLVGEFLPSSERINYYLNLSHQIRHKKSEAFAYYLNQTPISAVIVSSTAEKFHIITTVYTHNNFRGNGYARIILDNVCVGSDNEYQLLCEEHNVKFYIKCGFSVADTCVRFRL